MEPPKEKESLASQLKYYTTLTLGTTACVSSFVFMFLIPWVLDPSIKTLMANFDPEPVVCKTIQYDHAKGMKNCSWSSCKHGCTRDIYECDQIYVNYMLVPMRDFEGQDIEDDDELWVGRGLPLFINIKACGYPPSINCTIFNDNYSPEGSIFPCYYSRSDPDLVIANYDWNTEVQYIILALLIPNMLCGVSLGIVSYWWYPGCQKRRCQYQLPPGQEEEEEEEEDMEEVDCESSGGDVIREENELMDKKGRLHEEEKDRDTSLSMPEEKV